jgi:hypothetical protein
MLLLLLLLSAGRRLGHGHEAHCSNGRGKKGEEEERGGERENERENEKERTNERETPFWLDMG